MKNNKKRTYFTKSDLIEFGKYIESDERRGKKQRQAREHHEKGVILLTPWTMLIRQVTEEDVKDWLDFKQKKENAEKN